MSSTPEEFKAKVNSTIQKVFDHVPWIPGMAIAVVKNSQIMFMKGFGKTAIDSDSPVTDHTLFLLASISNSFAATLLLKQMEKQNPPLDLTTKVKDIIEDDFIFFDDERTQNATFVDILAHRMGSPEHNFLRLDPSITRADLHKRFKDMTSEKKFRESSQYSCLMFGFATYLSEKLSNGQSWEDLVASEIFAPLDMTSSEVITRLQNLENAAQGYLERSSLVPVPLEFIRRWETWAGSGGIMSNAVDMAKYMNFHLKNKDKEGNTFMSEENFAALHQEHNKLSYSIINEISKDLEVKTTETGYGLGWKRGKYRGHNILQQGGNTFGYCSFVTLFPEQEIGIFTAMNGYDARYNMRLLLHNFLSDVALEVAPHLDEETMCANIRRPEYVPLISEDKKDPVQIFEMLVGEYTNPIYGSLKVKNYLTNLSLEYGDCKWNLWKQKGEEKFLAEGTGLIKNLIDIGPVMFKVEEGGTSVKIEGFGIRIASEAPTVTFSRPTGTQSN